MKKGGHFLTYLSEGVPFCTLYQTDGKREKGKEIRVNQTQHKVKT